MRGLITFILLAICSTVNAGLILITPSDLGISTYDTKDGSAFGTPLNNFDLGTIDGELAGTTLTITTTSNAAGGWAGMDVADRYGTRDSSFVFNFNTPVEAYLSTSDLLTPLDLRTNAVGGGENMLFGGGGEMVLTSPFVPAGINFDTIGLTVENITGVNANIPFSWAYGGTELTTVSYSHNDNHPEFRTEPGGGLFTNANSLSLWVETSSTIPEPNS